MLARADFIVTDALQAMLGMDRTPVFPIQLAEAGVSVMYRPGLPHPDSFVRIDYAIPIGEAGRQNRLYVSYMRALNFQQR